MKFYTSVSESACKLLVEGLICELLLRMGINNVRGTSPCSVNEEPRILSGLLKFDRQVDVTSVHKTLRSQKKKKKKKN